MSKKDKIQLAIIWGLAFVLYLGLYIWFQIYTSTPAHAAAETYPTITAPTNGVCPPGSYNIGTKDGIEPICKLEPTGCPFGDSVPLDKCAPPPDIICNHDWSFCQPRENAPVEPTRPNDTNTAPTVQTPPSTPKTTNNVNSDASYAEPIANEPTEDQNVVAPVENANDDTPNNAAFGGIVKNDPEQNHSKTIWGVITAGVASVVAAIVTPSSWFAAIGAVLRRPFGN